MQDTKLSYQQWTIAIYLVTTNLKGVFSMKLHRDLGITQKTAWFLTMRIRETGILGIFEGPTEVDETYIGGREKNKREYKKLNAGRDTVDNTVVVDAKDRSSNDIRAMVVNSTNTKSLTNFVYSSSKKVSQIFTDEASAYDPLEGYDHQAVKHSAKQYVDGMAHTNGIESFLSLLKRGFYSTYYHMSAWQLQRYINEFAGRHNACCMDTERQMEKIVLGMLGKCLTYRKLKSINPHRSLNNPVNG